MDTIKRSEAGTHENEVGEFTNGLVIEVSPVKHPSNRRPFLIVRKAQEDNPVSQEKRSVPVHPIPDSDLLSLLGLKQGQESVLRALQPRSQRITLQLLQTVKALKDEGREPTQDEATEILRLIHLLESEASEHLDGEPGSFEPETFSDLDTALDSAFDGLEMIKQELHDVAPDASALPAGLMESLAMAKSGLVSAASLVGVSVQAPAEEPVFQEEGTEETDSQESETEPETGSQEAEATPEPEPATEPEVSDETDSGIDAEAVSEVSTEPEISLRTSAELLEDCKAMALRIVELEAEIQKQEAANKEALQRSQSEAASAPGMDDFKAVVSEVVQPLMEKIERLEAENERFETLVSAIVAKREAAVLKRMEEVDQREADLVKRMETVEKRYKELDNFHPGGRGDNDSEAALRAEPKASPRPNKPNFKEALVDNSGQVI